MSLFEEALMIDVREARAGDLEAILAIYNEAVVNTTATYDYEPRKPEAHRQWFEAKRAQALPVLVGIEAGEVAGFASYGPFRPWAAYLHTVENSIYVAPQKRGRGIGAAILGPLIEAAREKGFHAMVAGIDAANAASLKLHAKFGFEKVAHFREVGWKFERWLDLVFLQRIF
jgi:L-amino acid N-acyltransferase YncA